MLRNKRGLTLAGLIVVLIVVLAIGFGIYKILFVTKPLKITDLEDMYIVTPRSSLEPGWAINAIAGESGDAFGLVFDSTNEYEDGNSFRNPLRVFISIEQDRSFKWEEVNIPAGDRVELTYNGGRRLLVYLPRITHEDLISQEQGPEVYEFVLYVASNGSTYYDKKLTQLAHPTP